MNFLWLFNCVQVVFIDTIKLYRITGNFCGKNIRGFRG